jgi:nitrogen fixation NifU-like protein
MSDHEAEALVQLGSKFFSHASAPLNLGTLDTPDGTGRLVGQCGDAIRVDIGLKDDVIDRIRVLPEGCVFTRACASALSSLVQGRTLEEALEIEPEDVRDVLGELPEDHMHCARLAVNTLGEAVAEALRRRSSTSEESHV